MGQSYDTGGALRRPPEAPAGGATALFVAGFGAVGYATRRDLSALARVLWWALTALIAARGGPGLRLDPGRPGRPCAARVGDLRWSGDLRLPAAARTNEIDSARLLAASISLDILNVFQFFLSLRSESQLTARPPNGRHAGPGYRKKNP
jgi:modulator of FtsH protease